MKKVTILILIVFYILIVIQQILIFNINNEIKDIKAKQVDNFITIQKELSYLNRGNNYAD